MAAPFAAVGVVDIGTELLIEHISPPDSSGSFMWRTYVAVVVDLSGNRLMIGTGSPVALPSLSATCAVHEDIAHAE
ncbi:MAG: hypothetical protein QMD99_15640 [Rhizobiaceae bacterium]|nr:hypothetical protein [Rhizobiaceae bacterium]